MANESEYDDIRDSEDVARLHRLLKEALEVAHHIRLVHNVPDDTYDKQLPILSLRHSNQSASSNPPAR
jgi:hypothetical protein